MSREEIKERIIILCAEIFRDSGADTKLIEFMDFNDDLGMDSITFITLIVEIENAFSIVVPDDLLLMNKLRNIDAIVSVVERELLKGFNDC